MNRMLIAAIVTLAALGAFASTADARITTMRDGNTIRVAGDGSNDTVTIRADGSGAIDILDGDPTAPTQRFNFLRSSFAALLIDVGGGDDKVVFNPGGGPTTSGKTTEIDGGAGADWLDGGDGDDFIDGGIDDDVIRGNAGVDTILGGQGDDVGRWESGEGDDEFFGGDGDDEFGMTGTSVSERFRISATPSADLIRTTRDIGAVETRAFQTEAILISAQAGDDLIEVAASVPGTKRTTLFGGENDDTLTGGTSSDRLAGGSGDDVLTGGAGDDTLDLTVGDDNDVADGGPGLDSIRATGAVNPPTDDDFVITSAVTRVGVLIRGSASLDAIGAEKLFVAGQGGNDRITAAPGSGSVASITALGGDGDDRLVGSDADDVLAGGGGDDFLSGRSGKDTLTGEAGADTFECGGPGDVFDATLEDTVSADCTPPVAEEPAPTAQPSAPSQTTPPQETGPVEPPPLVLPAGFLGFAKPKVKGDLRKLTVAVKNTHSAPITVRVNAAERDGGNKAVQLKAVTRTIAAGGTANYRLATPRALRSVLARTITKNGRAVRKPVLTLTNVVTGGRLRVKPKVGLKRRG